MIKKTFKKEIKKLQIVITIIFLCMFIIGPLLNYSFIKNDGQETTNNPFNDIPKLQDYAANSSGQTNNINLTIHQAYHNSTVITIDEISNSFTVPAPNATDFNSSYVDLSINNIAISNHTLTIEETQAGSQYIDDLIYVTSFTTPTSCYIKNASFFVKKQLGWNDGNLGVVLFNSSNQLLPNYSIASAPTIGSIFVNDTDQQWSNSTFQLNSTTFLDSSKTYNNNWFIGLYKLPDQSTFRGDWFYRSDSGGDGNNSIALTQQGGSGWSSQLGLDYGARIGLSLNKTYTTPSEIRLKINNTLVYDNPNIPTNNSGFWNESGDAGINNLLNYVFEADWYNFALEVNSTQVNYTKSMIANTTYTVESGSDVYWESEANFTAFDHRLNNNTLNFTIPASWTAYDLKNDSISKAIDNTFLNGSSKIVSVYDTKATDGNWILYSNSTNLLTDVKIGVGGKETGIVYSNETLEFNATFSKPVTGNVNLSVYNNSFNKELVFSKLTSVVDSSFVSLNNWVISENLTTYGDHKVQVTWNNATDIAIIDSFITIAGETTYSIQNTNETEILDNSNAFNITLEYFDEFNLDNITGATIGYNLNLGDGWQSQVQNNADETYNITISPSDFLANGLKIIPITINKTDYMNYTFDYNFYIVSDTKLQELTANSTLDVIKGHNASYYLNYTEINDNPIIGANILEKTLNPNIEWGFEDLTGGNYSINLNTSQLDVGEYLCNFSITYTDFKTQIFDFNITVTLAQTQITFISVNETISRASGLNATIRIHITDTSNSQDLTGVPHSALTVYNGSNPSTTWDTGDWNYKMIEISDGEYWVNISLNGLDYGDKSVILNISHAPNYDYSTLEVPFYVEGNSTEIQNVELIDHTLLEVSAHNFSLYQHNPQLQISFDFVDTEVIMTTLNYNDDGLFTYYVFIDGNSVSQSIAWNIGLGKNIGNITLPSLSSDIHNITIITSLFNYENATYSFNLTINDAITEAVIDSIQQDLITVIETSGNYSVYESHNLEIGILYNDTINNQRISGASISLLHFNGNDYDANWESNGIYYWELNSSDLEIGSYIITVDFSSDTYHDSFLTFNISVIPEVIITFTQYLPESIEEGAYVNLTFTLTYPNGTSQVPLAFAQIKLSTNNSEFIPIFATTDSSGNVTFRFQVPTGNFESLQIIIEYDGSQVGIAEDSYEVSIIVTKPIILPPWAIWAIGIFALAIGSAVLVQKKIIAPRKLKYTDMIMSSATIFDDAINLQHLMIIYKNTGTSIFFKSFADEMLDPDLISGFLTAVQSFGKELKTHKSLNELSYGDKVLLFSDGDYIRVTLVLGKPASPYMKRNLAKFIAKFEAHYQLTLQMWKGQLNIFQDTPDLIDEVLHTSVILPHEITVDSKLEKNLRNSFCKQILSIARGLVSEDRKFLFLAQLLADSIEQTKKESAEIVLAINDLLECKVLIPIKIEKLEEQELSDQEIRTLAERVSVVPNKTDQEKQDLLKELLVLSSAEREVILSSLMQSITITTEISGETITAKKFKDIKEAKKEIKSLDKQARSALKEQDFNNSIRFYEIAEIISYQWNMDSSGKKYGNLVITTTVDKYRTTIKQSQKQGKKYEKMKDFNNALAEYGKVLDAAHNLFKLGFLDVEILIKEFTKKVAEIKKQTKQVPTAEDFLTKDHLVNQRKKLLSKWKKAQKSQDMVLRNELTTKLLIISNFLFKFGQVSESENIKKYHFVLDEIQDVIEDSNEVYIQETATRISELKLKTQQYLEYAKEAEEKEDYVNCLVVYQQALNTYCQVGDAENAIKLSLKIEALFRKIPNLEKIIQDYKAESAKLRANGDHDNALINEQYAETLEDALFIPRD
ncbi:hypothetical protein DSAG12_03900 [Promethearchaeum syntrophicum]|uniref:Uncharacterized protein n=1 Tax=Promethearchaeum syntrophicum TaxID=2594042 RepID=A0A5B9DG33_9ARCH|nr:hypothetical protein [Candidatus Prometheoarchaeum syntrophicum]QEE18062.1 hypothetical protein DSAG12_03900 [Candidatus Prometheoarchaeum syntrophicum]